jgi:hypothetical protein
MNIGSCVDVGNGIGSCGKFGGVGFGGKALEGEEGVRVRRLAAVIDSVEGLSNVSTTTISTTYDNDNDDENDTTDTARRATSPILARTASLQPLRIKRPA